jgi:acetyl-CoA C-acetyltransferase
MAVLVAAMQVQLGLSDLIIAGGVESMSQVEFYSAEPRWGARGGSLVLHDRLARARVTAGGVNYPVPHGMIETAENLRREMGIGREEQDELSVESHRRAVAAQDAGLFAAEIVPITVANRREQVTIDSDEHPRREATLESLSSLTPIMVTTDPEATVTAGNASGQNDGGAACIVTSRDTADALGLRPLARLITWAVAGVEPRVMGIGPVPAVKKALDRANLSLRDIDLIELNEAFASQVLACTRMWGLGPTDYQRLNVNGSGISLGHPVGATGARILATVLRELDRRQQRFALESMCIGGGQGLAAVFERVTS